MHIGCGHMAMGREAEAAADARDRASRGGSLDAFLASVDLAGNSPGPDEAKGRKGASRDANSLADLGSGAARARCVPVCSMWLLLAAVCGQFLGAWTFTAQTEWQTIIAANDNVSNAALWPPVSARCTYAA